MKNKAFTLVELLITISVLTILSTIGFVAYTNYLEDSRDTNRINQVQNIGDGLEFAFARQEKLELDNPVDVYIDGEKYSSQGDISESMLKKIKFFGSGDDPLTKQAYTVNISTSEKDYDVLTLLERPSNAPKKTYEDNFVLNSKSMLAYVYGKNNLGVFTDSDYNPINRTNSGDVNIDCSIDEGYKLVFESGLELSPISNQNINPEWPCYVDMGFFCKTRPNYPNATFYEGIPSEVNQDWIKSDNGASCSYTCDNGYTGLFCDIVTERVTPEVDYSDIESLLSRECNITEATFNSNFNSSTGEYNGDIICDGIGIRDDDLFLFQNFRRITGDFILDNNYITNLNPLNNLEYVGGIFSIQNNSLSNISILTNRSSNNFVNIDFSGNQLADLEGIRNLNSINYLDISDNNLTNISSISSMNNLLSLDLSDNNITDISSIGGRNSLRILNLANNNVSNINSLYGINGLEYLNLMNNDINTTYALRDMRNLTYINLSGNDSLNNVSYLGTITQTNGIFQISTRNYSNKIHNSSNICNNWTIRNQSGNNYPNVDHICN